MQIFCTLIIAVYACRHKSHTREIQSAKIDAYLFLDIKPYQSPISIGMDQWICIDLYSLSSHQPCWRSGSKSKRST